MTAPQLPPGWESSEGIVRLVDVGGDAVAWVAPQHGANCFGFAVRRDDGWAYLLHATDAAALSALPSRFGVPVLFPFPGHMRDFRYTWRGETYHVPRRDPARPTFTHGFAHTRPWHVVEQSDDRAVFAFTTPDDLPEDVRPAYPFAIAVRAEITVRGGILEIALHATNNGTDTAPVGLGLHPYFAAAAIAADRTAIEVRVPGAAERLADASSIPTGKLQPIAGDTPIAVPPLGQTIFTARTGIADGDAATMHGTATGNTVTFTFVEGVRDVVFFAPDAQPSISVEPHTCAPGAASQPEGAEGSLVALAPGDTRTMRVTIQLGRTQRPKQ